jgi:predicted AlkP superfamily phosphohydrolase/phosphomutase
MSRTLLIGLDGGTFTVLDALMDRGLMPTLAGLVRSGARADLMSTANPLTPLAWTSLITGRNPGHHGIFDFVRVEQTGSYPTFRLATSSDVRCPTMWSRLSDRGLVSISMNFPVMFPPRPFNGFMIPGFVPRRHLQRSMHPPALYQRLRGVPGINIDELPVDFEEERRSVQVLEAERQEEWVRFHIRREMQWYRVMRHLMETEPWALAAVIFDGTDKLQHTLWRYIDDGCWVESGADAHARRIRSLCHDYFRQLDDLIAGLVEVAGPDTRLLITSDHGFGPSDEIFYVNTWLAQNGFLTWRDDAPIAAEGFINPEGMKSAAFLFDWARTDAYSLTPGSNGVYLRAPAGGQAAAGAETARLADVRRRIIDGLLQVTNPKTGEKVVRRAMTREEAFPGPHSHLAADLTLVLRDYGFVSVTRSEEAVKVRREIAGAHRPNGIFVASGPGVRRGTLLPALSILDVSPLLMHGLGLPIPAEFEGRFEDSLFEGEWLAAHPAARDAGGGAAQAAAAEDSGMDEEGEATVMERLRSLGYLE